MNGFINSVSDVLVITQRNLIRYTRLPQLIIFSTVQPVMFLLLFNYVFGGAIGQTGTENYINFLLPGIIVQAVLFGGIQGSVGIATDMSSGIVDRLRSLPIHRAAFISGRVLADTVRNAFVVSIMIGVGFLIGFRFEDGPLSALIAMALVISFGFAFSWIAVAIGLLVKNPEAAQPAGFIWIFPLVFASSVFVPVQTMPEWLQIFARNQPVTKVAQAIRSFTIGGPHDALIPVLIWMSLITIIFMSVSVWLYRRS